MPLAGAACSGSEAPEVQAAERLLIDGGTVVVMDEAGTILEGGAVLVEGDRIAGLFDRAAPRPAGIPTLDATGQLVIPASSTPTDTPRCRCSGVWPTICR